MARRRYLSTEISIDKAVNRLAREHGDFAALLYTWMIPHAEDDATLTGDPEELMLSVVPGRRDKDVADVEAALAAMHDLGLIIWHREAKIVEFPPASFYKYQTYIARDKRRTTPISTQQRETPKLTDEQRAPATNAASPSPSPSPSPSMKAVGGSGGETASQQPAVPITDYERNCLNVLMSVKDYPFDFEKDLDMTRTFMVEFPMLDIYAEYQRWREYKRDKPLKKRSSPRLQLRNWMEKGQKFLIEQGVRSNERADRSHKGRAGTWTSLESIVIDGAGNEASPAG